jgi:hypothetical protein
MSEYLTADKLLDLTREIGKNYQIDFSLPEQSQGALIFISSAPKLDEKDSSNHYMMGHGSVIRGSERGILVALIIALRENSDFLETVKRAIDYLESDERRKVVDESVRRGVRFTKEDDDAIDNMLNEIFGKS